MLLEREAELSALRAALDVAGNEVVANLRKYDEMYQQLDNSYGADREQLTERLATGHEYIEGLKATADEKKEAVADMERRVSAIKDALGADLRDDAGFDVRDAVGCTRALRRVLLQPPTAAAAAAAAADARSGPVRSRRQPKVGVLIRRHAGSELDSIGRVRGGGPIRARGG
jgi:chromosome segregation ATPase